MIRDSFYDNKTSCFGIVEGFSVTVKCHTFHTKTTCFTVVIYSDIDISNSTLTHKLTLNALEAKVTFSLNTVLEKIFLYICILTVWL